MPGAIGKKRYDFNRTTSELQDVDQNGSLLAVSHTGNKLSIFDLASGAYSLQPTTYPIADVASIRFMSPNLVALGFNSTNTSVVYNISGNTFTTLSATQNCLDSHLQGIAADTNLNRAAYVEGGGAGNHVTFIDGIGLTATSVAIGIGTINCIVKKTPSSGTPNYIVGNQNAGNIGQVTEINGSGTVVSHFNLPITYQDGTSSTFTEFPATLAYYGDSLIVMTKNGSLLHYKYSTGALLKNKPFCANNVLPQTTQLGQIANGVLPILTYSPQSSNFLTLILYAVPDQVTFLGPMYELASVRLPNNTTSNGQKCGLNTAVNMLWAGWDKGRITAWDCPLVQQSSTDTQIQTTTTPPVILSGRIIRMPLLDETGCAMPVSAYQNIPAADTTIGQPFAGLDYLELADTYLTYSSGTVAVSATAVTGSGTSWHSSAIPVGALIGFGTTDPTAVTQWYEVLLVNSDTSITLTSSAGTIGSGSSYVIKYSDKAGQRVFSG